MDTRGPSHVFAAFSQLAGSSHIGAPRNQDGAGRLVLLDSPGVEQFVTIERTLGLMAVRIVPDVDK